MVEPTCEPLQRYSKGGSLWAVGLDPFQIPPDAYEACDENELEV
jgi:hypothetical protein